MRQHTLGSGVTIGLDERQILVVSALESNSSESVILLVHPDPKISEDLLVVVRRLPATVFHVTTCDEARSILTGKPVDLIVTALSLPDGNWECVFRFSVEISSAASILVITPKESEHLREEIVGRGGSGLVVEPLERSEDGTLLTLLEQSWRLGVAGRNRA